MAEVKKKIHNLNFSTRKPNSADINSNYGEEGCNTSTIIMYKMYAAVYCWHLVYTGSGLPPSTIWNDTLECFKFLNCIREDHG